MADNTAKGARRYFHDKLDEGYPFDEVEAFFWRCLHHFFRINKQAFFLNPDRRFSESDLLVFVRTVQALKDHQPIQYILGSTYFYEMELEVGPAVLIPRPETEELVDWIISLHANRKDLRILDVGTGSACIALALKKNIPNSVVYAIDVSADALFLAKKNATKLNMDIHFIQSDVLKDELEITDQLDIIVSNPPYVLHSESQKMRKNVLDHEPHLALFVPDQDALVFHRRISEIAMNKLVDGGSLYFEINEAYGSELKELLKDDGFEEVEIKQDLSGKNRFVKGIKR